MIPLLLLARLAQAEDPGAPTDPGTYERLFGTQPVAVAAPGASEPDTPSPWRMLAPTLLGVVGLFCAWRMRAGAPRLAAGKPIEVLCRHPLGDRNVLILLEVLDADGERRRLLVGTGSGAPTLVADLGQAQPASAADDVLAERRAEAFPTHAARRGIA